MSNPITPIIDYGGWWAKRDDLAYADPDGACGSKVRQYMQMMAEAPDNATLLVGCSAVSAQQVYIADAARRTGRRGIVVVPKRKVRSAATKWAARYAEVVEVDHGYRSVYMKRAKDLAKEVAPVVGWRPAMAVADTAQQVRAIPPGVKRIIVPTGSGLVAAGILVGLRYQRQNDIEVVAVKVSEMAQAEAIWSFVHRVIGPALTMATLTVIPPTVPYDKPAAGLLPDGTWLDPYYAAKAKNYVRECDLFWITGCRPKAAFP